MLEKGQIDRIVPRAQLKDELARLLAYATGRDPVAAYKPLPVTAEAPIEVPPEPPVEAESETKQKRKKPKKA